jgi:RimJ/RimL family protein N-acetyltransferase
MFAVTERLLLRPGWAEDAPALARAIGEEAIARNLSRVPFPYAVQDAEAFLAMPPAPLRPTFLIFLRDRPELVGGIGLHGETVPEIGYWIARPFQGHGMATEAGRAVVALADESLRLSRLVACHAIDNPASGRVLGKLGFQPTGGLDKLSSLARGEQMDVRLYSRDPAGMSQPLAA